MRADRYEALLDFLLEAVSDQGTTPFPAQVLAGMRRVVRCETVSYREWSPEEQLELALASDEPEAIMQVWPGYRHVRHDDPLPGGARNGSPLPDREWLGQALTISDFVSDRQFRSTGLYAEMCKPFGVRAVMKVFLPTGGATAAQFVFDTTRNRFTDTDRLALQRLMPHLVQLRRNAHARKSLPGAARFHGGGPDKAAAPHLTRAGGPGQGGRRRDERHDSASPLHQPRDCPQAPGAHLRQARSPYPDRGSRDLHPGASRRGRRGLEREV